MYLGTLDIWATKKVGSTMLMDTIVASILKPKIFSQETVRVRKNIYAHWKTIGRVPDTIYNVTVTSWQFDSLLRVINKALSLKAVQILQFVFATAVDLFKIFQGSTGIGELLSDCQNNEDVEVNVSASPETFDSVKKVEKCVGAMMSSCKLRQKSLDKINKVIKSCVDEEESIKNPDGTLPADFFDNKLVPKLEQDLSVCSTVSVAAVDALQTDVGKELCKSLQKTLTPVEGVVKGDVQKVVDSKLQEENEAATTVNVVNDVIQAKKVTCDKTGTLAFEATDPATGRPTTVLLKTSEETVKEIEKAPEKAGVEVKVLDNQLIVEAKHEEKVDPHGFVSRSFKRRYILPKNVDMPSLRI